MVKLPPPVRYSGRPSDLSEDECSTLAATVLRSLLTDESEARLQSGGHAQARAKLLGRIAARARGSAGEFHEWLLSHVLERCKERLPFLMAYLYEEHAAHLSRRAAHEALAAQGAQGALEEPQAPQGVQEAQEPHSEYEGVLRSVLPAVCRALPPNDRAYTALLLDVPALPPALLLELVQADLAEPSRRLLGLATARDVALRRDALAPPIVGLLLQLAIDGLDAIRAPLGGASGSGESGESGAASGERGEAEVGPPPTTAEQAGSTPAAADASGAGVGGQGADGGETAAAAAAAGAHGKLRDDVIRVLAGELYPAPHLGVRVQAFAESRLADALKSDDAARSKVQMRLYVALCAQRPQLLWGLLRGHTSATPTAQAVVAEQAAALAPHVDSAALGAILLDAMRAVEPPISPALLLGLLHALAASEAPLPPMFVEGTVALCTGVLGRVDYALALVPQLNAGQVERLLPWILVRPPPEPTGALVTLIHAQPAPLPPTQLMLALHLMPTGGAAGGGGANAPAVSLKQLIEATQTCIAERAVFTMEVLSSCLKLIVQQEPLPLLSMRTAIQALVYWPPIAPFMMDLLRHLITRQIWAVPRLWLGFIKCCQAGLPHSLPVLASLPATQVRDVLTQLPELSGPLQSYAVTHAAELTPDVLDVLGLTDGEAEDLAL